MPKTPKEIEPIGASVGEVVDAVIGGGGAAPLMEEMINSPVDDLPVAHWRGTMNIMGTDVPCYVLRDGQEIIGRTSATELLTGIKGGGSLEKTIGVNSLEPFINRDLVLERLVPFRLPEVDGLEKQVKGLPHDLIDRGVSGVVFRVPSIDGPEIAIPVDD